MRRPARLGLSIVVILSVLLVVGALNPAGLARPPSDQVIPTTVLDIFPEPTSEPSGPSGGGGGGGSGGGGGGGSGGSGGGGSGSGSNTGGGVVPRVRTGGGGSGGAPSMPPFAGPTTTIGSFSSDRLVQIAVRLRELGFSPSAATRKAYTPFIIAGDAAWSNSWGAPRFGPGKLVRRHEGQDVFCHQGAPVLASENGRIEFGQGGLGGRVARLYRGDGSYWYYAHLDDWNTRQFSSGSYVRAGDVIGYCGDSGNAEGGAPHVHFGWYAGGAQDPMDYLIRWLRTAERRATRLLARIAGRRIARYDQLVLARRFGSAFTPDRSTLRLGDGAAWGSDYPASGPYALTVTALRAALSSEPAPRAKAATRPADRGADGKSAITGPRPAEQPD